MFALKYKEVGLKIAYYRKKKGYTQTQLAEMVGISSNYLSLIERGNKGQSYSMETLFKIAEALESKCERFTGRNINLSILFIYS